MIRRPPRYTHTNTLFPYTTLFRSTNSCVLQGLLCGYVSIFALFAHADALPARQGFGEVGPYYRTHQGRPVAEVLAIWREHNARAPMVERIAHLLKVLPQRRVDAHSEIGRASCRERVCQYV